MKIARCTAPCLIAVATLVPVPLAVASKLDGGAHYSGKTSDGNSVTLRLSGNRQRVARMRIHYTLQCDNGQRETTYTDILNAPVRGGQKFTSSGSYTGTGDQSLNKFKATGTLKRRTASGTFSLSYTGPKNAAGDAVSCKTGALRWHASRAG
jgi:hypothetical protein